jgi:hypothetical protein
MHPVVELSVDSTAKESLTKLDGALRERRNVVIWWYRDHSTFNANFDVCGKRSEKQWSGKVPG